MSHRTRVLAALALAVPLAGGTAAAQVRHRRPMGPAPDVRYGFDNNRGGGCRDYACGSRCYDGHSGTDFPISLGTTVLASADGTVVETNDGCANYGGYGNTCGGRCGNYIRIQHADGTRSLYCHMMRGAHQVRRGQRVRCGQAIGRSASSGSSTGPHLHFGWQRSGVSTDAFRGRCTGSPGAWTDQRSYPDSPGDRCACSPSTEVCNGRDDDCDGRVDDGVSRSCYTGPAGTSGRGACRAGRQSCGSGRWGTCAGQVVPRTEVCDRVDNDCDGRVDDGVSRSCYTGPAGTQGRGACRAGTQACSNGAWATTCAGQVVPRAETCNRVDDDCDGRVDEDVCGVDAGPPRDAPASDVPAAVDAGHDAGVEDAGGDDIGPEDAGFEDAGFEDAGFEDAGFEDAGGDDAGGDDAPEFEDVGEAPVDGDGVSPDREDPADPEGCSCRAGATGATGARGALAVLAALSALLGRRRRRR